MKVYALNEWFKDSDGRAHTVIKLCVNKEKLIEEAKKLAVDVYEEGCYKQGYHTSLYKEDIKTENGNPIIRIEENSCFGTTILFKKIDDDKDKWSDIIYSIAEWEVEE